MSDTNIGTATLTTPIDTKVAMAKEAIRSFHMSCTRIHKGNIREQTLLSIPLNFFKRGE